MTIIVDAKNLHAALTAVRPAVTSRGGSLPILRCARIDVDGAYLVATDLDTTIAVDLFSQGSGDALVPVRETLDALKGWRGPVTIDVDGAAVTLANDAGTVTLRSGERDDWPRTGERVDVYAWNLEDVDRRALETCARAASSDDCRPILTGILIETTGAARTYAATDTYRLDVTEYPCDAPERRTLVPARAVRIALKAGAVEHCKITREAGSDYVTFSGAGRYVTSRTIDGDFPNYRGLIPAAPPYGLRIDAAELRDACAAAVKLNGRDGAAPLRLENMSGTGARVRCVVPDRGETVRTIGATHEHGARIALNPAYLRDALEGIDGAATVRMVDALKPVTITSDAEPCRVALLMPVRLEDDANRGTFFPELEDAPEPVRLAPAAGALTPAPRKPRTRKPAATTTAPAPKPEPAPVPAPFADWAMIPADGPTWGAVLADALRNQAAPTLEPAPAPAAPTDGAALPATVVDWLDRLVFADKRAYAAAWAAHVIHGADAPADPGTDWADKARRRLARVLAAA